MCICQQAFLVMCSYPSHCDQRCQELALFNFKCDVFKYFLFSNVRSIFTRLIKPPFMEFCLSCGSLKALAYMLYSDCYIVAHYRFSAKLADWLLKWEASDEGYANNYKWNKCVPPTVKNTPYCNDLFILCYYRISRILYGLCKRVHKN